MFKFLEEQKTTKMDLLWKKKTLNSPTGKEIQLIF